jgi:hypothetical protein
LLLVVISWCFDINFRLLAKAAEVLRKLPEILSSHIGHRFERRRLEVFEASMVEDLAY